MSFLNIIIFIITGILSAMTVNILKFRLPGFRNILKLKNYCLGCKNNYRLIDYFPIIVYITRKGRCSFCGEKFPLNKLFADIISILTVLALGIAFSLTYKFLITLILMTILLSIVFIDIEDMVIPDILSFTLLGFGFLIVFLNTFIDLSFYQVSDAWWEPLLGIIPGTGFLLLIGIISILVFKNDNTLGMGDVKLFAPIGIFLGLEKCIAAVIISFLAGGIFSIILLLTGRVNREKAIPFAPFIVLAAFISLIFGENIIEYIGEIV